MIRNLNRTPPLPQQWRISNISSLHFIWQMYLIGHHLERYTRLLVHIANPKHEVFAVIKKLFVFCKAENIPLGPTEFISCE